MNQKKISNEEVRTEIGRRLREERERRGLKQEDYFRFGDWSARTVSNWEAGRTMPTAEFFADVETLGLDVNYIITGRRAAGPLTGPAAAPAGDADTIRIPLFSATGSMGKGNDLITDDVLMGDVPISRHWLALNVPRSRPEALQLVHAYGDSMLGTLNSGDFAIVDTDCQVADIDGVYVLQANGQLFIKRVTRRMDGAHVITSDNPSVRTVDVLDGTQPVRICGRVVYGWNGRRF
ncbi:S24 family peptidase [Acidovorax sp. sic0104]|uniref:S24 family peptidase n=1 Tax=Acidovorax sp. sic0104 TaxID=2854784 RepID=UPI001C481125|nr:S24 family peptidase [Acidovorax sp. sic0104]MBV7542837.1 helix-turn-helix domain-containing protein [Acidovorax sp. sic0104]